MVITITSNINQVRRFLSNLPQRLDRISELTIRNLAREGKIFAREKTNLPFKTGGLKAGIIDTMVNKKRARILSSVTDVYPYNLWINQEPGWETLDKSQVVSPFFKPGQTPFRYGDAGVVSPTGRRIRWSGQSRFFHKTFTFVKNKAASEFVKNFRRELERS